ncbi:hypothetical protein EDB80DRAFT_717790 [Ilyonectria destructans]|nr:hypothetical protein EDB80DRAFT_717790 [Ilyonectria destructans]
MTVLITLQCSRRCTAFYLHLLVLAICSSESNPHLHYAPAVHRACLRLVFSWLRTPGNHEAIMNNTATLGRTRQLLCDWSPCNALPLSSSSHPTAFATPIANTAIVA